MNTTASRSDAAWGYLPLRETMIQIGNNTFHKEGNLDKVIEEKMGQARWIDKKLHVEPSDVVLEIGPGLGIQTKYFGDKAHLVYAVDVSDGFKELFDKFCGTHPNVRRIVKTFFPMLTEIADGEIDCGYAIAVFCHLHVFDIFLYLEEISQKLKKGGVFFLNYQNSDNGHLGDLFQSSLSEYRNGEFFRPVHVAQMQFHSRAFFRSVGLKVGLSIIHEETHQSYTEMTFLKY
jgi:SAM-dependent methyltransferase